MCVGPESDTRSSVTVPSASRRSFAASVPPNVAPGLTPGSARQSTPNVRVIQTEPSFFGKPWIQPRTSAKSRSTQIAGQVVTCSPSRVAFRIRKNSLYWLRAGSTSSLRSVTQLCQSTNSAAARPGSSAYGSSPAGSAAAAASGSHQNSITRKSPT